MVRAIAYLAESFDLEVTAEGVEKEEQRKRLRELGCESAQGYLFGRPIPADDVIAMICGDPHNGLARWPQHGDGRSAGPGENAAPIVASA